MAGISCADPNKDPDQVDSLQQILATIMQKGLSEDKSPRQAEDENKNDDICAEAQVFKDIIDKGGKLDKKVLFAESCMPNSRSLPSSKQRKNRMANRTKVNRSSC